MGVSAFVPIRTPRHKRHRAPRRTRPRERGGDDRGIKPARELELDALIVTKCDYLPLNEDFDMDRLKAQARMLNPNLEIFVTSARTGEGIGDRLPLWNEIFELGYFVLGACWHPGLRDRTDLFGAAATAVDTVFDTPPTSTSAAGIATVLAAVRHRLTSQTPAGGDSSGAPAEW